MLLEASRKAIVRGRVSVLGWGDTVECRLKTVFRCGDTGPVARVKTQKVANLAHTSMACQVPHRASPELCRWLTNQLTEPLDVSL